MRKIIIAGAGHGGLSCAYNLVKNGYDVTVFEAQAEAVIGHDWGDMMDLNTFEFIGMPRPDKSIYTKGKQMCFYNPSKTVKLTLPFNEKDENSVFIERKPLLKHLISCCREAGVKFSFDTKILSPIVENDTVKGINIEHGGKERPVYGDIVVDAAGLNSPVRRNLPENMGIENEITGGEIFSAYRAYFNTTEKIITDPPYSVFFYHGNKPGIDWAITEEDHIDILIGKFGEMSQEEIDNSIAEIRKSYPQMGDKILRGGYTGKIPVRKTLPLIVGNGVALVGDSAAMTVPLNGSGINLSLRAGKLLASQIMNIKNNAFSKENLWGYQYRYNKIFGENLIIVSMLRSFVCDLTPENIDFFLEKKIITEKEVSIADNNAAITITDVIQKIIAFIPQAYLLPTLVNNMKGALYLSKVSDMMPAVYDEKKVSEWLAKYNNL